MISKRELFWIAVMAIIYVTAVKYYAIAPITNLVAAALFGWELADYI